MNIFLIAIIAISVSGLLAGTSQVFAPCLVGVTSCGPPPGVTVAASPDSQFYEKNDTITIQGQVYIQNYTKPVTIQIISPNNTKLESLNASVNDGTFSSKIAANFNTTGLYQLVYCTSNGCDRSYIKFVSEPYRLTINGKDFDIKYKSFADLAGIEADINSQALRVHIENATAQGLQFVIELPRELIDSKGYGGKDANFQVLIGMHQPDKYMQPANFTEISSNDQSRTLAIDIPYEPVSNSNGIWDFKIMHADVSSGPGISSEPPLKLFKLGMSLDQIKCRQGLVLVTKSEDNSPACVSTNTALDLILKGWATQNHDQNKVNVIGTEETISYNGANTTIIGAIKNPREQRLTLALNTTDKGILSITIPKQLLDLNSSVPKDQFYILSNSGTTNPNETYTAQDRTLAIPIYPKDDQVTISVMSWIQNLARLGLDLHSHPATIPTCDTPFVPKKDDTSPLYPNDTRIITTYTPVFFMPTNSTGKLCVNYTNWNTPSEGYITIFEAQNLSKNAQDVTVSPDHISVPTGTTDMVYTIKSGNAGFYGIRFFCGGYPFAIGYNDQSNIVKQDFPWLDQEFMCGAITYSADITGTSGIGVHYIPNIVKEKIDYNITGTSVSSVHLSPTIQNVTFTVNVQTFNDSSKFWFDIKDSQYVKFNGDPKLVQEETDPCTWTFTDNNAVTDERQWSKMVGKVTVTDRPITIPPHTNGTYSFSILAKDLDAGYYGLDPIYYGVPVDSNITPENLGGGSIGSYYPVTMGMDKYLDPSGVCSR